MHPASTTDHDDARDFVISRLLSAPRELVFEAWINPRHMARWWGPRITTTPVCEMDVRIGGKYRVTMRMPDGTDYPIIGEYREVVRPAKLVFTMDCSEHPAAWHDMVQPNRATDDVNPVGIMLATISFEERDNKTMLTVRIRMANATIRDAMMNMGMHGGWSLSLDKLEELITEVGH
jgi:uncharacterized protein YndB with AHSA1/START domain